MPTITIFFFISSRFLSLSVFLLFLLFSPTTFFSFPPTECFLSALCSVRGKLYFAIFFLSAGEREERLPVDEFDDSEKWLLFGVFPVAELVTQLLLDDLERGDGDGLSAVSQALRPYF